VRNGGHKRKVPLQKLFDPLPSINAVRMEAHARPLKAASGRSKHAFFSPQFRTLKRHH